MGYARLLSNMALLVNDTMRRPFSSTSSGNHLLSIENDIDIKLYEALGKNIVFALGKMSAFDKMRFKYNNELERMSFYNNEENIDPTSSMVSMSMMLLSHDVCLYLSSHLMYYICHPLYAAADVKLCSLCNIFRKR